MTLPPSSVTVTFTCAIVVLSYNFSHELFTATKIIEQIQSEFIEGCEFSIILARIYIALDEIDIAYGLLEQAFENHETDLIAIISDPRLTKAIKEPKFKELIKRIGIPI